MVSLIVDVQYMYVKRIVLAHSRLNHGTFSCTLKTAGSSGFLWSEPVHILGPWWGEPEQGQRSFVHCPRGFCLKERETRKWNDPTLSRNSGAGHFYSQPFVMVCTFSPWEISARVSELSAVLAVTCYLLCAGIFVKDNCTWQWVQCHWYFENSVRLSRVQVRCVFSMHSPILTSVTAFQMTHDFWHDFWLCQHSVSFFVVSGLHFNNDHFYTFLLYPWDVGSISFLWFFR